MKTAFVIVKHILQGAIIALVALYALLYALVSIPAVQNKLRDVSVNALTQQIGVPVDVARVELSPFNRVELFGVYLPDQRGDTLLYAHKVATSIDLLELPGGKINLSNIQVFGLDARLASDSIGAPLNLQFVIDAFTDPARPKTTPQIDLTINSALIRRSSVRYDVLSQPHKAPGTFDPHHIAVTDLLATLSVKALNKDSLNVNIKRLGFKEQSGLAVERLSLRVKGNRERAVMTHCSLLTGRSHLYVDTAAVELPATLTATSMTDSARFVFAIEDAVLHPADFAPFFAPLRDVDMPVSLACRIEGTPRNIAARRVAIDAGDDAVHFATSVTVRDAFTPHSMQVHCPGFTLDAQPDAIATICRAVGADNGQVSKIVAALGEVRAEGALQGNVQDIEGDVRLYTAVGDVMAHVQAVKQPHGDDYTCHANVLTDGVNLAALPGAHTQLGLVAFDLHTDARLRPGTKPEGVVAGSIGRLDYRGYSYSNILVGAQYAGGDAGCQLVVDDPNAYLLVNGNLLQHGRERAARVDLIADEIDLAALNLTEAYPGYRLTARAHMTAHGNSLDDLNATLAVDSLLFTNGDSHFAWNELVVEARNNTMPQYITIASDYVNGRLEGRYDFSTLGRSVMGMVGELLPSVVSQQQSNTRKRELPPDNDMRWRIEVEPHIEMAQILRFPFTITDRAVISGYYNDLQQRAHIDASLPNLWVGKKHIEDASLYVDRRGEKLNYALQANLLNKKKVATVWSLHGNVANDKIDVGVNWNTNTTTTYCGAVRLDAQLAPCEENPGGIDMDIAVQPTQLIINDTIWDIKPARILVHEKNILVDRLELSRPSQHIYIEGRASDNPADTLHVDLRDVNLDYIFETLNINYVTFGGRATGSVDAANLFTKKPYLATRELNVRDFSYNDAVFGDISLYSMLNTDNMGIVLKGIIAGRDNRESYVDGYIFPTQDSLYIDFDIDHLPIAFIRPFVDKIFSDVDGAASGHLTLGGNFKRIFLEGDALGHDFSFGIPFLNTRYHLTDSVHFTKSSIYFNDVTAFDEHGHTAISDGILRHKYFTNLSYDISIHDAENFLVFNIPNRPGAIYYGTVYGTGDAAIVGDDFRTGIDVNMATEAGSSFTFVLTNSASAADYNFLTFSNTREKKREEQHFVQEVDSDVVRNNMLVEQHSIAPERQNVLYVTLQADITPQADITLVMDEVTGDKMTAKGEGNIRLEYNTAEDDFEMFGSYTVNTGRYNFSLQDIITRDFTITSGSTVSFRGSPLDAILDINAVYSLQANLADLDESFVTDGELTRTTIPVHTILKLAGNLTQPDIAFDIELPTVSADVDSKMRSIISTDEMMNRQIIYLLALNRFFTPDYNVGLNGNNEWVSMASSTLSSSLGSILGQISENWNISPNIRSEKGDFSDMEVDLVLSSQLLNNRLLFNGNFGYRDKRYNSTNFVGDFDIEYLLTESGNLRLKAYNHFNDRNYTMRTALTTQGIGIMYTHDFDTWTKFFDSPRRNRKKELKKEQQVDTIPSIITDTMPPVPVDSVTLITPLGTDQ